MSSLPRWFILFLLAGGVTFPLSAAEDGGTPPVVLEAEKVPPDGKFRFLATWRAPALPRTAFALSGGAAWGLAHIGLLQAAEEDGLSPDLIAGTSFGAVVGSLVSSGMSPGAIEKLFREQDFNQVLSHQDRPATHSSPFDPLDPEVALLTMGRGRVQRARTYKGAIPDWGIQTELFRLLGRAGAVSEGNLDNLAVPFRAVSVDLVKGEVYAPSSGSLSTLVRASLGLPVFRPVLFEGKLLVDGGVLENVPTPTARKMGGELVIAVGLNREGKNLLEPISEITSWGALLERTYDVAFAAQRQNQLELADLVILTAVGQASLADFHDQLDLLLDAGRRAWKEHREDVLQVLEACSHDPRVFTLRNVEAGPGTQPGQAEELRRRLELEGSPREVSALRLQLELVRLLRRGEHSSGRLELPGNGRLVLSLAPMAPVRVVDMEIPPSLAPEFDGFPEGPFEGGPQTVVTDIEQRLFRARQRGLLFAGITKGRWEESSGRLEIEIEPGTLGGFELRSVSSGRPLSMPSTLQPLAGQPASLDRLRETAVRSFQRGEVAGITSVAARRGEKGDYLIRVEVEDPPVWEAAVNGGFSDSLGVVAIGRIAWPSFAGWNRWGLEVRGAAAREGVVIGAETTPPGAVSRQLFFGVIGGRTMVPQFTEDADLIGSRGFWSGAALFGLRTNPGRLGFFEAALVARDTGWGGFPDRTVFPGSDLSGALAWRGDRRNDSFWPSRGLTWCLEGVAPVAGNDRPWQVSGSLGWHVPLDAGRRWIAELDLFGAKTEKGPPLPFDRWFDPGGWWEAPRLLPSRGLTPSGYRATLAMRHQLGSLGGISVAAGLSGALWSLDEERFDQNVPRRGHGAALFFEARTSRFGPLILGLTSGHLQGGSVFLLFGISRFPRIGIFPRLPGT